MIKMKYVGRLVALRGREALVRPSDKEGQVLAQFDYPPDTKFDEKGSPLGTLEPIAHLTSNDIVPNFGEEHPECFGWHGYPVSDFIPVEEKELCQ